MVKISLNFSGLSFIAFLLIFPLDYISFVLTYLYNVHLPLGFFGHLITFLIIFILILGKKLSTSNILEFMVIAMFILPISISKNSQDQDYLLLLKMLGGFSIGIYLFNFLKVRKILIRNVSNLLVILMTILISIQPPIGNYLRLADAFVVTSLFSLIYNRNFFTFVIINFISIYSLYIIGSRSGLISYTILSLILFYLKYGAVKFLFFIPLVIYKVIEFFLTYNQTIVDYNQNRLFRLIFDTEDDTSLNLRKSLNKFGYKIFLQHPITGDFGYYRSIFRGEGFYAHNYISYLAEFGVIGILFLLIFSIKYIIFFKGFYNQKVRKEHDLYIFCLTTLSVIGVISAKSFIWLIPFVALGLMQTSLDSKFKK